MMDRVVLIARALGAVNQKSVRNKFGQIRDFRKSCDCLDYKCTVFCKNTEEGENNNNNNKI